MARRALFGFALAGLALGCGGPTTRAPSAGQVRVVAVEPDTAHRPGVVLLQWEGEAAELGKSFAVLDDSGYRGLLRTRAVSKVDCDHCPGPLVEADLVEGRGPSAFGAVAVGPVSGPLPHGKLGRVAGSHARGAAWEPVLHVDLDGDGQWDVDQVERCGHSVRSGCSGEVCDMICTASTHPGRAPDARDIHCRSFVPDVEDCGAGPD